MKKIKECIKNPIVVGHPDEDAIVPNRPNSIWLRI